jgi:hypothetical protein
LFSACKPTEVAYNTGGHGDFTVAASLLVVPSANRLTDAEFLAKVREAFSSQPRQNPDFNGPRAAKSRIFLGALIGAGDSAVGGVADSGLVSGFGTGAATISGAIFALPDAAAGAAEGLGAGGIDPLAASLPRQG